MNNVRWESPFPYTLAFNLFKQHFEEINRSYWAFVPSSNTIKKAAKEALQENNSAPTDFFLIPDEEDRRLASNYEDWNKDYSLFINYTRLSMIMLISSCFETYLRTVVSLAFESKPGVIINCRDAVDGANLLKNDINYGNLNDKSYRFIDEIDDVCRGDWTKRFSSFEKYFGPLPSKLLALSSDLDELRRTRNDVGHYFGRKKTDYEAPIDFIPKDIIQVSHKKILGYLKTTFYAAKFIDNFLQKEIIGSYDIIKVYFTALSTNEIKRNIKATTNTQLQELIGRQNLERVPHSYFARLVAFCEVQYSENKEECVFSRKRCVAEINRRLYEKGVRLSCGEKVVRFNISYFSKLLETYNLYSNLNYSKSVNSKHSTNQYLHSVLLIDFVTDLLCSKSDSIIKELDEAKTKKVNKVS